jgi:hypothetical protein
MHTGSHHASPIGASLSASSSQQNPIQASTWGAAGPPPYSVPPLPPSNAALLYSTQGSPRPFTHSGNMTTDSYSEMPSLALGYPTQSTASPPSNAPHRSIDPQFAIGALQDMPTTSQAYSYGPTASAQPGPSAHPSGQYAPINPSEVYETLIGNSVSAGAHMKDDKEPNQCSVRFWRSQCPHRRNLPSQAAFE